MLGSACLYDLVYVFPRPTPSARGRALHHYTAHPYFRQPCSEALHAEATRSRRICVWWTSA